MRRPLLLFVAAGLLAAPAVQAQPYGAVYTPNPLTCLTPGQVTLHKVGLRNTGTNYWTIERPNAYHLAYHWYQGATPVIYEGDRTVLPKVVGSVNSALPNAVTIFANLTAPAALGTYTLRWDMVHENVTWFSNQGVPTGDQTVEVKASCPSILGTLCAKVDCTAFSPRIERIIPFISNSTPGGYLAIAGSGFGEGKGNVWIRGMTRWNGAAYGGTGNVLLEVAPPPGEDHWKPKLVLARIPSYLTQVNDQRVKLQVQTSTGAMSNLHEIDFKAARDVQMVPSSDPAVRLIHCGTDSTSDYCNNWSDPDDTFEYVAACGQHTFWGSHWNYWYGTDSDTDRYTIELKNGWSLESMAWTLDISAEGEASAAPPSGFVPGDDSWQANVAYWVTNWDLVCYGVDVFASGPRGVPWK
ncbi:MAG: hypothetical protein ACRDFT_06045 [bacterium]